MDRWIISVICLSLSRSQDHGQCPGLCVGGLLCDILCVLCCAAACWGKTRTDGQDRLHKEEEQAWPASQQCLEWGDLINIPWLCAGAGGPLELQCPGALRGVNAGLVAASVSPVLGLLH